MTYNVFGGKLNLVKSVSQSSTCINVRRSLYKQEIRYLVLLSAQCGYMPYTRLRLHGIIQLTIYWKARNL